MADQPVASTSDVKGKKRGAFIVLEGLDRSGKSTQCGKLVENLCARGIPATGIRFPGETSEARGLKDS